MEIFLQRILEKNFTVQREVQYTVHKRLEKNIGWIRICTWNADPDPDSSVQKMSRKKEKSAEIKCFEMLDVLF
jgi:hypothetical protein